MTFIVKRVNNTTEIFNKYKELDPPKEGNKLKPLLDLNEQDPEKIQKVIKYIDRWNNFPNLTKKLLEKNNLKKINIVALVRFYDNKCVFKCTINDLCNFLGLTNSGRITIISRFCNEMHNDRIIFIHRWREFRHKTHITSPWGINYYILKWILNPKTGNLRRHPPVKRLEEIRQFMIWAALEKKFKTTYKKNLFLNHVDWINENLKRHIRAKS